MPSQTKGWMHLNNGGINRPSLLSGGAQAKGQAPNSGRILADMEGRQATASARAARASAGGNRRLGLWLGIGAVVVALAGLAAWGFSGSSDYPEPSEYSLTPDPAHATGHPDIPAGAPRDGAAMIVDAPLWEPGLHPRGSTEGWAWADTARVQLSLALSLHTAARAHADVVAFSVPQ